jgi:hypothetical protein
MYNKAMEGQSRLILLALSEDAIPVSFNVDQSGKEVSSSSQTVPHGATEANKDE